MSTTMQPLTWSVRVFRLLLGLFSTRFRRAYGAEMEQVFCRRLSRAKERGTAAFVYELAHAYADLIASAIRQRFAGPANITVRDPMHVIVARDVKLAARTCLRRPAFFATVVLTLGLGIGAATAIASLVDATILRPVPYPNPDRLVAMVEDSPRFGKVSFAIAFVREFRERLTQYDAIAAFTSSWDVTLTGAGEARTVPAAFVSDGLLELFGARVRSGRLLTRADEQAASKVAVVSERFWARTFGAGTPLGGQIIQINDEPLTVVGILAGDFKMPITSSLAVANQQTAELWLPMSRNPFASVRTVAVANIVGRLAPGATVTNAQQEVSRLPAELSQAYPEVRADARYTAIPLARLVAEPVRRPLVALLGAVLVLLLIACANVASLTLARSASQAGELAVRAALGASRGRLMQQLLAESLVLAGAGTAMGVLVAWLAISVVPSLALGDLPPSATIQMSARVAAIAGVAGLTVAMLVAMVMAVQSSRAAAFRTIRDGARTVGGDGQRMRGALVFAEVALALVLLVSAGLLARSFWSLSRVDPGFRTDRLLANSVGMPGTRYPTPESRQAFVARVLDRIQALPGVARAAAVNRLPLGGANVLTGVEIEGQPQKDGPISMDRRVVTDTYFSTLGIPLRSGRAFVTGDSADTAERVAIVNEAVTRRFWPSGDPLDKRLRLMLRNGPGPWLRVVGVVGDVRHHGLDQPAQPEVYVPYAQAPVESMVFVAQTIGDPLQLAGPVRYVLQELDPLLPVRQETPDGLLHASIAEPRIRALLFNGFGLAALLLSALGIYGVVAHAVDRRTREIGVRMALGATRTSILGLVMRNGMRMVIAGAVAGLIAAAPVTLALRGLLFGIPALDPLTFAGVTGLLLLVAVFAILAPALRATRLDPTTALRVD
jgi:putative ABC transport system permease protein